MEAGVSAIARLRVRATQRSVVLLILSLVWPSDSSDFSAKGTREFGLMRSRK
jgi:hypothetical protein